jgi:hypothetical protein
LGRRYTSLGVLGAERDVKFWTDRMSVIEQRIELFRTRLREESNLLKLERRETPWMRLKQNRIVYKV